MMSIRASFVRRSYGSVRRLVFVALIYAFAEGVGRVQDANSENKTHEEAANVGEIVQPGEETEDEGDDYVEHDECEVFPRTGSVVPGIEQVEERQGQNAEERAGGTGGGNACCGEVPT